MGEKSLIEAINAMPARDGQKKIEQLRIGAAVNLVTPSDVRCTCGAVVTKSGTQDAAHYVGEERVNGVVYNVLQYDKPKHCPDCGKTIYKRAVPVTR